MTYNTAVITYHDEDTGLVFSWHGGAYIDVGYVGEAPGDVINVWNDEEEVSYLEVGAKSNHRPFRATLEGFEDSCREYLSDLGEEENDNA